MDFSVFLTRSRVSSPLKVFDTRLSDTILEATHGLLNLLLDLVSADDIEGLQEVVRHSDEGVLGPAAEPVHGAARDQTRELQGSVTELLSNLGRKNTFIHQSLKLESFHVLSTCVFMPTDILQPVTLLPLSRYTLELLSEQYVQ